MPLLLKHNCSHLYLFSASIAVCALASCNGGNHATPVDVQAETLVPDVPINDVMMDTTLSEITDVYVVDIPRVEDPFARPIFPLSTMTATRRSPTLHWKIPGNSRDVQVQICFDRLCNQVETTHTTSQEQWTVDRELSPSVHYWRVIDGSHASATWWFQSPQQNGVADTAWKSVADTDGDGQSEVLIAGNHGAAERGVVYVFPGSSGVIQQDAGSPDADVIESPNTVLTGTQASGHFGWSVAAAGDLNGDGLGDVAVGAPDVQRSQGRVYIYYGRPTGLPNQFDLELSPPSTSTIGTTFGTSVASAG